MSEEVTIKLADGTRWVGTLVRKDVSVESIQVAPQEVVSGRKLCTWTIMGVRPKPKRKRCGARHEGAGVTCNLAMGHEGSHAQIDKRRSSWAQDGT